MKWSFPVEISGHFPWHFWVSRHFRQAQLSEVLEIYSTDYAFAALARSRRVVCWGDTEHGGEVPSSLEETR